MADGVVVPLRKEAEQKPEVGKYRKMFDEARDALADARVQGEIDRDYYDGKQWTPEEKARLQRRKQPVQTYNLTRVAINGMVGIVERMQTDPKAWPRNGPDEQAGDIATKTLRYVADQNNLDRLKVRAARDFFIEGVCAAIVEAEEEAPDYAVKIRRIAWKEFFADPFSQEETYSDARYMGVAKWMDQEDLLAMYPNEADAIEGSYEGPVAQDATFEDRPNRAWADRRRKRLMVVEMYHREKGAWSRCVFARGGVLEYGPSPYMDEQGKPCCPIEAASYAKDRENMPYGAVRDLRSPQDGYNHRQSKLLHMLNVRQTFGSKSAVADVSALKTELAKPDGHAELEHGEFGRDFGVIPVSDQIAGQFQLLIEARSQMERLLPSKGLIGRTSAGESGKALTIQQDAGMTELADPFGGLTDWELRILRQCWARCKQFWTEPRWIRVSDDLGAPQFIQVNDPGGGVRLAESVVDITIDTTPESPTMQEAQFQLMGEMIKMGMPIPPETVIEASQLRNKGEIAKKIGEMRQMQAQQPNPAVEKLKLDAAKAHEEQEIERERLRLEQEKVAQAERLELSRIQAEAAKAQAEAEKARADVELARVKVELEREKLANERQKMDLERERMAFDANMEERRHGLEREKIADGREGRMMDAQRAEREAAQPKKQEKPDRSDAGLKAIGEGLKAIAEVQGRAKKLKRPDGSELVIE